MVLMTGKDTQSVTIWSAQVNKGRGRSEEKVTAISLEAETWAIQDWNMWKKQSNTNATKDCQRNYSIQTQ